MTRFISFHSFDGAASRHGGLSGYKREELRGRSILKTELLCFSQKLRAIKLLTKNLEGKEVGSDEFILTKKDGCQVLVEIRTRAIELAGLGKVVLAIAREISESTIPPVHP